jgi:succinate dehydrogenase hydrophobic anchor subunit
MTQAATGLLLAAFLLYLGYAAATAPQSFPDAWPSLWGDPWFRVILADLYLGFVLVAAWIGWRERSWTKGLVWGLLLCVLGNAGTLAYVLWVSRSVPRDRRFVVHLLLGKHAPEDLQ